MLKFKNRSKKNKYFFLKDMAYMFCSYGLKNLYFQSKLWASVYQRKIF